MKTLITSWSIAAMAVFGAWFPPAIEADPSPLTELEVIHKLLKNVKTW